MYLDKKNVCASVDFEIITCKPMYLSVYLKFLKIYSTIYILDTY